MGLLQQKTEEEENAKKKPGMMDMLKQALEMQNAWDRCTICHRQLPPGTPMNKLYDEKLGAITACVDCSLKAVLWYVKRMNDDA